jgi:hypothetical protein
MKITEKQIRDAIKALEEAKTQCPQCKKWFGSNPKLSGYVVKNGILSLWCIKCFNKLESKR